MANNNLKTLKYDYDQNKVIDLLNKNFALIEWALGGKLNGQNLDTKYLADFVADHATITELSASKITAGAIGLDKGITMSSNIITIDKNGVVITRQDGAAELDFTAGTIGMFALVGATMVPKLWFDAEKGTYVFDGMLSADVIEALSAIITPNLYAEKATIAGITVDQLDTSDKVQKYLDADGSDDNYQKIYAQFHEFVTAQTDGLEANKVAATNRSGEALYWTNDTHVAASTTVTSYPVYVYNYTESNKLKLGFEIDPSGETSYYIPVVEMGAGTGTGNNGKGYIYKGTDGLYIQYVHSTAGTIFTIKITDDGIDFSDLPSVTFSTTTTILGVPQLWVRPDQPTGAKTNDAWIDTDDYSRYEKTALTAAATLLISSNEFITASGTFTITLHAATSSGIIKKIYNIGTGIITIAGTINGATNMILYPKESVELITDGTAWRY